MPNPDVPTLDLARRRVGLALLLGGGWASLLAGCASRPPVARPGGGVATRSAPVPPSQPPLELDPAGREESVAQAMLLVNTPYRYGGNTPEGGFDCSGLVRYVFDHVAAGTPAARRPPAHRPPRPRLRAPRRQLKTIAIGSRSDAARLRQGSACALPRHAGRGWARPQAPRTQRPTTDQPAFWLFLSFSYSHAVPQRSHT